MNGLTVLADKYGGQMHLRPDQWCAEFLPVGKRVIFDEDNDFSWGMDFRFFRGIPSDVIFTVRENSKESLTLIAPGYGMKDNYGCGAIHVSKNQDRVMKKERPKCSHCDGTGIEPE